MEKRSYVDPDAVKRLQHSFHRMFRLMNSRDVFGDLPRSEFFLLQVIDDYYCRRRAEGEKGVTVTRLAEILEMGPPTASKLLRVVERKGYIRRLSDEADRRVVYVCLSEQGLALIEEAKRKADERTRWILEQLGERDSAELLRLVERLRELLYQRGELERAQNPTVDRKEATPQ